MQFQKGNKFWLARSSHGRVKRAAHPAPFNLCVVAQEGGRRWLGQGDNGLGLVDGALTWVALHQL